MGGMNGVETRSTKSELHATARESVSPFYDYRILFRTAELDRVPSHCDNSSAASGLSSPKNGDTQAPLHSPRDPFRGVKSVNGSRTYKRDWVHTAA
jgi:hypothetical protein